MNRKTGLNLTPLHTRKSKFNPDIAQASLERLRVLLDNEYRFLDQVRRLQKPERSESQAAQQP